MTQQNPKESIIFNIEELVQVFSDHGNGMFNASVPGLYRKGSITPVLVPNGVYYRNQQTNIPIPSDPSRCIVNQVPHKWDDRIESNVYNEDGIVLVYFRQRHLYCFEPAINKSAYDAALGLINHVVENHSNIYPLEHDSREQVVLSHMSPEIKRIWEYYTLRGPADDAVYDNKERRTIYQPASDNFEMIDKRLNTIIGGGILAIEEKLRQWMGKYHWHVFVVNVRGFDICVNRGQDYRIMVWEAEHGSKFRQMNHGKKIR